MPCDDFSYQMSIIFGYAVMGCELDTPMKSEVSTSIVVRFTVTMASK